LIIVGLTSGLYYNYGTIMITNVKIECID